MDVHRTEHTHMNQLQGWLQQSLKYFEIAVASTVLYMYLMNALGSFYA